MTARYRLTEKCFIPPYLLGEGSVIETDAEPGLGWEPLNPEAREAKERLYGKDFEIRDPITNQVVVKKLNAMKKMPGEGGTPACAPITTIISEAPPSSGETLMSLAESAVSRASPAESIVDGQARLNIPGEPVPRDVSSDPYGAEPVGPKRGGVGPVAESVDGGIKVLAAVEPPSLKAPSGLGGAV